MEVMLSSSFETNVPVSGRPEVRDLNSTTEKIKRFFITITLFLPVSTRSFAAIAIKFPVRFVQSIIKAIRTQETFAKSMKEYMKMDCSGGISDWYTRLDPKNQHDQNIGEELYQYAACVVIDAEAIDVQELGESEGEAAIKEMTLEFKKLGFVSDDKGNFYDCKTGNIFYFKEVDNNGKKELLACFQGIGSAQNRLGMKDSPNKNKAIEEISNRSEELKGILTGPSKTKMKNLNAFLKQFDFLTELEIHSLSNKLAGKDKPKKSKSSDVGGLSAMNDIVDELNENQVEEKQEEESEDQKLKNLIEYSLSGHSLTSALKQMYADSNGPAAVKEFFGGIGSSALQAVEIGKILKRTAEKHKLTTGVVGFSHGGGLAQAAAIANGIKAYVFNSRPMGASVRRYLMTLVGGLRKFTEHAEMVTAVSTKGDYLTATKLVNVLAAWFERMTGIVVPRTVAGRAYHIPVEANSDKILNYPLICHTAFGDQIDALIKGERITNPIFTD